MYEGNLIPSLLAMVEAAEEKAQYSKTCVAFIRTNIDGTEGNLCGRPAVAETELCARCLAENGV